MTLLLTTSSSTSLEIVGKPKVLTPELIGSNKRKNINIQIKS